MNGQNKSRSKRCSFISWTPGPSVCSRKSFKIKIVLFLLCFIATRGNHHLFIYYSCRPRWHPVNYGKWNGRGLGHVFHSGSIFVFSLNAANFVLLCLVQLSPQKTSTSSLLLKPTCLTNIRSAPLLGIDRNFGQCLIKDTRCRGGAWKETKEKS